MANKRYLSNLQCAVVEKDIKSVDATMHKYTFVYSINSFRKAVGIRAEQEDKAHRWQFILPH